MAETNETSDLLTKLREGLNKGLRIVNIWSKEAYETLKIKNQIKKLRTKRRRNIEDVGNAVYRMYKHNNKFNEESLRSKCMDISSLEDEIEERQQELRVVHLNAQKELGSLKQLAKPIVVGRCECGADLYKGIKFCGKCFRKIEFS
ncbi:MAG TPA: hypothetical protein VGA95_00710 [Thermodesulfobacteriota bacterium]